MKRISAWPWENSWSLFALFGLVMIPWLTTLATVPHLGEVYAGATPSTLWKVVVFGALWGTGATLFGLGISRVGMALGFSLILGMTASFGSLFPMIILHPEQLLARRGLALIAGTIVMIAGLVLLSLAGLARERDRGEASSRNSGFKLGLVICIFSGIFSSLLNFSFVFGDELRVRSLAAGASAGVAANPIWALTVSAGSLANLLYCGYLLSKNRTWGAYGKGNVALNWLLGISMGALWFSGTALYGTGAAIMGSLGNIVGWPIFMTVDILVALFWGAVSGEWKGARRRALAYCWIGVCVLLAAIAVISYGNAA